MKIERVEAIPISIPLTKVFSGSSYRVESRATVITRIFTSGGLVNEVLTATTGCMARSLPA